MYIIYYFCMNLKFFRRIKYCLNINNCSGEETSLCGNVVFEDSSLIYFLVVVILFKLKIMSKKLLRKGSRKYKRRKM